MSEIGIYESEGVNSGDLGPLDELTRDGLLNKIAETPDLYHRAKLQNYMLEDIKNVLGRILVANEGKDLVDPVPAKPRYLDVDRHSSMVKVFRDCAGDELYSIIESDPETGETIRKWAINTATGELDMPLVWRNGREIEVGQEPFYALVKKRHFCSLLRGVEKSAEAERNIKTMAGTSIACAELDITTE